jgi:hypothetical protein
MPITGNTVNYETPADQSPEDMAVATIEDRVVRQFASLTAGEATRRATEDHADPDGAKERAKRYEEEDRKLMTTLRDRAMKHFDDLRKRRGDAQAFADVTSGAIGLPADMEARQAEIERREREMNAQHRMQMGQGEQYAILEGTQPNPNGTARIDQASPDPMHPFLAVDMRGKGENIARQVQDVQNGLVDVRTGERFGSPQPHLLARAQAAAPMPPPPPGQPSSGPGGVPTPEQQRLAADVASGKYSPMANVQGSQGKNSSDSTQSHDDRIRSLLRRAKEERDKPKG